MKKEDVQKKWGKEDFSRKKYYCVACRKPIDHDKKKFLTLGNYCLDCSSGCSVNINHKVIDIKPYDT